MSSNAHQQRHLQQWAATQAMFSSPPSQLSLPTVVSAPFAPAPYVGDNSQYSLHSVSSAESSGFGQQQLMMHNPHHQAAQQQQQHLTVAYGTAASTTPNSSTSAEVPPLAPIAGGIDGGCGIVSGGQRRNTIDSNSSSSFTTVNSLTATGNGLGAACATTAVAPSGDDVMVKSGELPLSGTSLSCVGGSGDGSPLVLSPTPHPQQQQQQQQQQYHQQFQPQQLVYATAPAQYAQPQQQQGAAYFIPQQLQQQQPQQALAYAGGAAYVMTQTGPGGVQCLVPVQFAQQQPQHVGLPGGGVVYHHGGVAQPQFVQPYAFPAAGATASVPTAVLAPAGGGYASAPVAATSSSAPAAGIVSPGLLARPPAQHVFEQQQRASQLSDPDAKRQLIVNYLAPHVTSEELFALFQPFGNLESARVIHDHETRTSKGYGFLYFTSDASANAALQQMTGFRLHGKHLRLSFTTNPSKGR